MPSITSEYFYFTEDGLMWFSTSRGLTSFDGSEIVYHSTLQEANALGLNRINAIAEDKEHNLYIGSSSIGYFNRRSKSFTPLTYEYKDVNRQIETRGFAIFVDKEGTVFIGLADRGMLIYDPRSKKMEHLNLDSTQPDSWADRRMNTVVSFAAHNTDESKLWVGSYRGIYLLDKKKKSLWYNFKIITPRRHIDQPASWTTDLFVDVAKMDVADDSTIWFNSWAGGFGHYNTKTGQVRIFLHDAVMKTKDRYFGYIIRKFAKMADGNYLLGIFNPHPGIFNPKTQAIQLVKLSPESFFDGVRFVTNDRNGNIWLLSKGTLYYSAPGHSQLKTVPIYVNNKPGGQLRGLYYDSASSNYYGAVFHSTGVHVYDSNFRQLRLISTPVINNYFTYQRSVTQKITKDGSGRWWTAGWENYVLTPGNTRFENVEKIFPKLRWMKAKGEYFDVITDKNGDLLYKQGDGTVYHINHRTLETDTIISVFKTAEDIEIKSPSKWYDTARHYVYIVQKKGIAQFNLGTKKSLTLPYASLFGHLSGNQGVCAPALDPEGKIWLMIPKYGIRIIDPDTFRCTDSIPWGAKGLFRGDYTAITAAEKPYMFLRSLNGIVVYDYIRQQSHLLDDRNGLSNPENISLLYSNGHLVIGQTAGFEYLKLTGLKSYSFTVIPSLNTITSDSTVLFMEADADEEKITRVRYNQNSLVFSFSAQEFFTPERIEYAYQLTGVDKDWRYTNSFNRTVTYSNLAPGKYTFLLKAQMTGGNWAEEPIAYTLAIVPAFWQTNWFKILGALLILSLLYYFYRRRIHDIRRRELQKSRHEKELLELEARALRAQMNPHFIFNSLNSIKSLINKNENTKAADYLTTFSKLIRTLFQNSDKREVSLFDELETCRLYTELEKMRFGEKIKFDFEISASADLKDIKVPALILQPFIENAIWHGLVPKENGGKVLITVTENDGTVECSIDDDGIGRELSKQYKAQYRDTHESKGIGLIKSRMELDRLLNEREENIRIIDKLGKAGFPSGTTVIITFKENK